MFAISVESSHEIGMGHFYRMLHLTSVLKSKNESYFFLINNDSKIINILSKLNEPYEIIEYDDFTSNWETKLIEKFSISHWISDRLRSDIRHFKHIKKNNILLISLDDVGEGAKLSDLNIVSLPSMQQYPHFGKKIIDDFDYFIINPEIDLYKKERTFDKINLCVSLGGADTHGVTIKVLKKLKLMGILADIHIGPSFKHYGVLEKELISGYKIIDSPKSLIAELQNYNLMICGGGITPFEVNALGIPSLIIANEGFEIKNAQFLQQLGSSVFLGYYQTINWKILENYHTLNLKSMSQAGLNKITSQGTKKVYNEILTL